MGPESPSTSTVERRGERTIVDCDVHVIPAETEAILERMPYHFRQKGYFLPGGHSVPPSGAGGVRKDIDTESGPAGSVPTVTRTHHLDALDIDYAIVNDVGQLGVHPNYRYAAALARAQNDWLAEEWLATDDRLYGSISVPPQYPEAAASEIDRLGSHPDFVQVLVGAGTRSPLGQERYWPIYEAAVAEGLPVAVHVIPGGGIDVPNSPAGYPSSYAERHLAHPNIYYGQLASLVFEGVFEAFPDLTVVLVEGGFGWVPHLLWRMDRYWRLLEDECHRLTRPPSEYVREQVRFTTQPVAEPDSPAHLRALLEMLYAEETLMYATDYPHWDGDYTPRAAFPGVRGDLERAIFAENAMAIYDF